MGHTHNFQSSGWGCQILSWSWDSRSRLIGISQGGRHRRGFISENQVWEGQNGAMRRRWVPLTFTLHRTAGIRFTGGNAYRLTFGHGWANASMPRVIGKLRENQSRHWDDSWEAKRSTSASPNRFQIWDSVWRFNIRSPGLSFCLEGKSAARFSIPGTWTALKERNLSWDQRRRWRASLSRVRDREPPWRLMWDTTAMLSVLTIIWCSPRTGRKCIKARKTDLSSRQFMCQEGTLLSIPRAPVCLRRLRPSPSLMRPSWSYGDGESHPFWPHSGEKQGPAIVKRVDSNCTTPWLGKWLVSWDVISALSPTKGTASCEATLGATQWRPLPWGLAACGRYLLRHDGIWTESKWTPKKHGSLRGEENTLLGVHSEAKRMNVAENDISVTTH